MGRTGLEFAVGIPGSVGGAVRMNAGAFGGEVKDVLQRVRIVDETGKFRSLQAAGMVFSYRHTSLPKKAVVVDATFSCPPGAIRTDVYERSVGRKKTQPIWERSFGSTFVNPPGRFAAEMIEGCGLKGRRQGGAMFSDLHANFIVNVDGHATAADVDRPGRGQEQVRRGTEDGGDRHWQSLIRLVNAKRRSAHERAAWSRYSSWVCLSSLRCISTTTRRRRNALR
jgi:UDP-N-acetylmuramate dehydrogenase